MPTDYSLDGVGPSVEIGKGNSRVKASGSALQARDNADAAFANVQGADPSVDDDLATKRYVDGLLGALPSVDLYDATGGTSLGVGSFVAIPMDTARQIDTSEFTHSGSNAHFTWVGASGTKVLVKGRFTVSATVAQQARGRLTIDTGSGFTEVVGSRSAEDVPSSGNEVTIECFAILTLNNGDTVRLEGEGNSPLSPSTIANSSGLEAVALINAQGGGGSSGVEANQFQRKQVQTSVSLITGKSVATPTGLWDFNQVLTELTTGGSGRDFNMPGISGNADAYSLVEGVPGGSAEVYGLFLDSDSMAEVDNPSLWKIRTDEADLSISVWVRVDDYNSTGESQQQGIVGYLSRSSATIGTTTASTYFMWFDPLSAGGTYFRPRFGYYDNQGTPAFVGVSWNTALARPIRVSPGQWVHLGARRVRNGVNDVDTFLYVNGELVDSILGQNDSADPTSTSMRLICGARQASADELLGTIRDLAIWRADIGAAGIKSMYEIGVGL